MVTVTPAVTRFLPWNREVPRCAIEPVLADDRATAVPEGCPIWIISRRPTADRLRPLGARSRRSAQLLTSDIGASRSRSLDETVITPDCALAFTSADKLQPISMQRHSASALDQGFVTDV